MISDKLKNFKFYLFLILFLILIFYLFTNVFQKEKKLTLEPISLNLLTSTHPDLSWSFKPVKSKIIVKPGDVTAIEYFVENLSNEKTTGIATFAYFPSKFGNYVTKINCFCYDAQTLKPKEKNNFTLILLIDPAVTKDSKTKDIKEATIQFTFFDYKKNKKLENKS
tara:strand:- start:7755 stop:8252 length:498 start_codon:yes stop_codon:yes gene_type:complete